MNRPLSTAELLALGDLLAGASNDLLDRGCEEHDRIDLHDVLHAEQVHVSLTVRQLRGIAHALHAVPYLRRDGQ